MFEFVCVVYLTKELSSHQYIGHFESCAACNTYVDERYEDKEWVKCLHEDYLYLPDRLIKKEMK